MGALAADCAPILLADTQNGIVGAAHSGWRGAFDGIIASVIDTMCAHGGQRQQLKLLSASKSPPKCLYEVGPEFIVAL